MPSSTDKVLLSEIVPKNVLSFGPENSGVGLQSLNLLIGPNGSGKSNLIETINLMRSAPKEFRDATRKGGGVSEWIWKGQLGGRASIGCTFNSPMRLKNSILHKIVFRSIAQAFALDDERIEDSRPIYAGDPDVFFFYRYEGGYPSLNTVRDGKRQIAVDTIERDRSILAQRRDPEAYPELAWLAQYYEKVRIYREWSFGQSAVFREPQKADMRNDSLEEDFSNLGLFLNRLKTRFPVAKRAILAGLRDLYDGINDFDVLIEGGTVQVFFTEGDFTIPATRLSDGTLRYLCLLTILCDPEPPPLICIEEPELGLHPDILPKVADLMRTASLRSQLIVTTHSDILVDAMSNSPEAVIVCEKLHGQTTMERLNPADLSDWLTRYRLGQLWTKGEIGNAVVKSQLYIEGGESKTDQIRCREGFRKLLEKAGMTGRMPRLNACGGRNSAFDGFKTAHSRGHPGDYVAMLVDSEEPVADIEEPWSHLKARDNWDAPEGADNEQVFLMTTCMETWVVSDRAALREHYGHKLQENALPPLHDLEKRDRHEIYDRLAHATRNCSNAYAKGKRSFEMLGLLGFAALSALPSFARMVRVLDDKL